MGGVCWLLVGVPRLEVDASLRSPPSSTPATVFGAPSPGGMGMADVALVEGAVYLIPGVARPQRWPPRCSCASPP